MIKDWTIHISGIDVLDNTLVIDIKPYHYKDAVDEEYLSKINKVETMTSDVTFTPSAEEELL
jgi:tRNA (Thr-GGU) A37 N-methylase